MPTLIEPGRVSLLGSWRAVRRVDLSSHVAHYGPLAEPPTGDAPWGRRLARLLEEAGLRGRGGGAFPTGTKVGLVAEARRRVAVVVNAMEGEPGSEKDAVLLMYAPHLVLDGALQVAAALGAARVVICIPDNRSDLRASIVRAVAERTETGSSPRIDVAMAPARYISGEESALVAWLDGAPCAPVFRRDKSVPLRLGGDAVLVQNVETLGHVALITRYGSEWFRGQGVNGASGSCLITVSGAVTYAGVLDVALGTPVGDIVDRAVPTAPVAAVLVGGLSGSWVAGADLRTPYAPDALAEIGASLGAGVIGVLPEAACGIAETARVARYMAGESSGQCGPCVFGLGAIAEDLASLAEGSCAADTLTTLAHRCTSVTGRGACRHPDGVARLVTSALSAFKDDAVAHAAGRPCPNMTSRWLRVPNGPNP